MGQEGKNTWEDVITHSDIQPSIQYPLFFNFSIFFKCSQGHKRVMLVESLTLLLLVVWCRSAWVWESRCFNSHSMMVEKYFNSTRLIWLCFVACCSAWVLMFFSVDRIKIIDCSKAVQSYLNALYLIRCHHKKAAGFAAPSLHVCSFPIWSMIFLKSVKMSATGCLFLCTESS